MRQKLLVFNEREDITMDGYEHHWMHGHPWGYGFGWWSETLLSALSTLLWLALLIGLAWMLLKWIMPYIKPMISDIFGMPPADTPPLEILRQRYAAGEIDAVTFEQMRERLEASYQRGSYSFPHGGNSYTREAWTGYRQPFPSSGGEQRSGWMAEQERYTPGK
jgi:uncharacterized membrane protein